MVMDLQSCELSGLKMPRSKTCSSNMINYLGSTNAMFSHGWMRVKYECNNYFMNPNGLLPSHVKMHTNLASAIDAFFLQAQLTVS